MTVFWKSTAHGIGKRVVVAGDDSFYKVNWLKWLRRRD